MFRRSFLIIRGLQSAFYPVELKLPQSGKGKEKNMEDFQVINNYLVVRLPEEVDHHRAGYICEQADRYIVKREVSHVVFDFGNTRFMDSSGIGIIMGRYKKISCFGGKVYAVHTDKQVKRILYLAGLDRFVEIMDGGMSL